MESYVLLVLSALLLSTAAEIPYPRDTKQYREDYEYNPDTNAFYKLHIESRQGWNVDNVCKVEGAELMSPATDNDIIQLHGMFKKYPDLGDYVYVANDGRDHESAEEQPIIDLNPPETDSDRRNANGCMVVTREGAVENMRCYRSLPFICKVNARDAPYDPHCEVYATGYQYFASVRSCYKIPRIVYTWSEAYEECRSELAHLVVLNSETEREIVQNLTCSQPKFATARFSWFFLAGFRADKPATPAAGTTAAPRIFKTIFNQTLEQAGFSQWSPNEPNNALGREYCGSVFQNDGKLNDVDCTHLYGFVCEKEVKK
ncbi:uncharacterized protein LOC142972559 [Anticarsia gemmatalis]|uniref:uncharacterized protein LOC142972559 n=1 Tax=Anticarsia gemmatalis TaxID=129554 RepID=UPI003F77264B